METFEPGLDGGEPTFSSTIFSFIDADNNVYYGLSLRRKRNLGLQGIKDGLVLLPDEEVYPKLTPKLQDELTIIPRTAAI